MAFGPSCPQTVTPAGFGPWTHEYVVGGPVSEDCLTLNVWAPAASKGRAPVLVWIHGGAFVSGGASVPIYDGAALARRGIVVVSINYRLGYLGFFASPELRDAGGGNFGLQDQIAALSWVRGNIAAFGGDPTRVTIAGQSAGGMSVHDLLLSPKARGLFDRAIAQSGLGLGLGPNLAAAPRARAEAAAAMLLKAAGAATLDDARGMPLAQLEAAAAKSGGAMRFAPYEDGAVLPDDSVAAFRAGRDSDVPVMVGLTADEGSGGGVYRIADEDSYVRRLKTRFGPLAQQAAQVYPWTGPSTYPGQVRDAGLASVQLWARERARHARQPLYAYIFTHIEPGAQSDRYGAFHTSDVPYAFGTLDKAPERGFSARDRQIADTIGRYWVNFVATGDPNGAGLPAWAPFDRGETFLDLGDPTRVYPPLSAPKLELFGRQFEAGRSLPAL